MWLTLLLGCRSPEVSAFLDDRVAAICARHARCDSLADAGYADEAACLVALDTSTQAQGNEGGLTCEVFDPDAAEACLSTYEEAGCDEPPDLTECEAVCR